MPFGHCNFIDFRFQVSHRQMFNITNSLQSHRMVSPPYGVTTLQFLCDVPSKSHLMSSSKLLEQSLKSVPLRSRRVMMLLMKSNNTSHADYEE